MGQFHRANIKAQENQLTLFTEATWIDFQIYISFDLYDEFMAEFKDIVKDVKRYNVGPFYDCEGLCTNIDKIELAKKKYLKF